MNFSAIKKSHTRPCDVAKILGVSRVAVSLWLNKHSSPHRLIEKRVTYLLDAIKGAVLAGDLPLPEDTPRTERYELFEEKVLAHLPAGITLAE